MIETDATGLTIRRTFNAPRERVWEAWTDPEQVGAWWGPDGFTITTNEIDVQPGGSWRFVMIGPEGEEYQNRIAYDEIVVPERLAYTHGSPNDPEQFQVTVVFDEEDSGTTELTMEMGFPSSSKLDEDVEFGAVEGAKETLDSLADHLTNGSDEGEN
jgi:uncharacterized protein YndB with AHSA1/START domain